MLNIYSFRGSRNVDDNERSEVYWIFGGSAAGLSASLHVISDYENQSQREERGFKFSLEAPSSDLMSNDPRCWLRVCSLSRS